MSTNGFGLLFIVFFSPSSLITHHQLLRVMEEPWTLKPKDRKSKLFQILVSRCLLSLYLEFQFNPTFCSLLFLVPQRGIIQWSTPCVCLSFHPVSSQMDFILFHFIYAAIILCILRYNFIKYVWKIIYIILCYRLHIFLYFLCRTMIKDSRRTEHPNPNSQIVSS